jgi:hypothetical protein
MSDVGYAPAGGGNIAAWADVAAKNIAPAPTSAAKEPPINLRESMVFSFEVSPTGRKNHDEHERQMSARYRLDPPLARDITLAVASVISGGRFFRARRYQLQCRRP